MIFGPKNNLNYFQLFLGFEIKRMDSGYDSVDLNDTEWLDHFYDMFVDEFYYAPENYEYQFGSFTFEEIKEMDVIIDELFEELFGDEVDELALPINELTLNGKNNNENNTDTGVVFEFEKNVKEEDLEEDWETETDGVEFHLKSPVKNIPIGMTINDVSGREFEQRVPLLRHFDAFDISNVPEAGLPQMTQRQKNQQKWKSKKKRKEQENLNVDPNIGGGKTYGKTEEGEIIVLV